MPSNLTYGPTTTRIVERDDIDRYWRAFHEDAPVWLAPCWRYVRAIIPRGDDTFDVELEDVRNGQ